MVKRANVWNTQLEDGIDDILANCTCASAKIPKPVPKVSLSNLIGAKQTKVELDIVYFDGVSHLHSVDCVSKYSEAVPLKNRSMEEVTKAFAISWIHRHGPPKYVQTDEEFDTKLFRNICASYDIELQVIAAEAHNQQGTIEVANRILKQFYRRICSESNSDKKPHNWIVSESIFAKNIAFGAKGTSVYEIVYGRQPRIVPGNDDLVLSPTTLQVFQSRLAKQKLRRAAHASPQNYANIQQGDFCKFYREHQGWLGPSRVLGISGNKIRLMHNNRVKTVALSHVQKIETPLEVWIDEYREEEEESDQPRTHETDEAPSTPAQGSPAEPIESGQNPAIRAPELSLASPSLEDALNLINQRIINCSTRCRSRPGGRHQWHKSNNFLRNAVCTLTKLGSYCGV